MIKSTCGLILNSDEDSRTLLWTNMTTVTNSAFSLLHSYVRIQAEGKPCSRYYDNLSKKLSSYSIKYCKDRITHLTQDVNVHLTQDVSALIVHLTQDVTREGKQ